MSSPATGGRSLRDRRRALGFGRAAEDCVGLLLQEQGWEVLARNWAGGGGELDLVVARRGRVRFVEVKARDPRDPNLADAIGREKRRRLALAATAWMAAHGEPAVDCAFLVALATPITGGGWHVELIDDAFSEG